MSVAMAKCAGGPGIGALKRLGQQGKNPFDIGIQKTARDPMPFQYAEELGQSSRRLGRLGNRRVYQDHGVKIADNTQEWQVQFYPCHRLSAMRRVLVDSMSFPNGPQADRTARGAVPASVEDALRRQLRPGNDRALTASAYGAIDLLLQGAYTLLPENAVHIDLESPAAFRTKRLNLIVVSIGIWAHP